MRSVLIICVLLLGACKAEKQAPDLSYLTGYWEITEVRDAEGILKSYPANTTIDYLLWDGQSGYRKKVQPTLLGTYRTSDDAIKFDLEQSQEQILLTFKGESETWQEKLSAVGPDALILVHSTGLTFYYKRYQPIITLEDVPQAQ